MMQKVIDDLLKNGNYSDYPIEEIIAILQTADDEYSNDGELSSFDISDAEYDVIRLNAKRLAPNDVYFTGVGSSIRGGKVDLPNPMPSLEQVEIGDIETWVRDNDLKSEDAVLTDKMDGTSLQLIYDKNGDLQIAYSRGDGLQGADVTRHVRKMKNLKQKIAKGPLAVRAEVELSNTAFEEIRKLVLSGSGKVYKNPRNMTAGMMNKEVAHQPFYDSVDVFVYEILNTKLDKQESLKELKSLGFNVPVYKVVKGKWLTDEMLADYLNSRRSSLDYDMDGLVITVDSAALKKQMDKGISGTDDPKSSIKYKVADASNQFEATVTGVTYALSKHAVGKPTIQMEPFDIQGVTIQNTTGFNAKFIKDNNIGPGAKLLMTRSGDVIPYIIKVTKQAKDWSKPADFKDYKWNETGVDIVLKDPDSHPEVMIQKILDMCRSLEIPGLKEGSVRTLFEAGYKTPASVLTISRKELERLIGKNGIKIHEGIEAKLGNLVFSDLMGSAPFFGIGLGKRKFKALLEAKSWKLDDDGIPVMSQFNMKNVVGVEGFQEITAEKFIEGIPAFRDFLSEVRHLITIKQVKKAGATGGKMKGQMVVFTGFRDKELEEAIEAAGGTIQNSVNSKTTILVAKDPNSNSGKMGKARAAGVKVLGAADIKAML